MTTKRSKPKESKAPAPSPAGWPPITGNPTGVVAPDYSLIKFYAGLLPCDMRLLSTSLATGDGAAILAMAQTLLQENRELQSIADHCREHHHW